MTDLSIRQIKRIARKEAQEAAKEQLAAGTDQGTSHETDADDLAHSAMTGNDVKHAHAEQLSPRETILERYDVDAADYDTEAELLADVQEARAARGE